MSNGSLKEIPQIHVTHTFNRNWKLSILKPSFELPLLLEYHPEPAIVFYCAPCIFAVRDLKRSTQCSFAKLLSLSGHFKQTNALREVYRMWCR
jgi:hypothetical protein